MAAHGACYQPHRRMMAAPGGLLVVVRQEVPECSRSYTGVADRNGAPMKIYIIFS